MAKAVIIPEEIVEHFKKYWKYNEDTGIAYWVKLPKHSGGVKIGDEVGFIHKTGYRVVKYKNKQYKFHRILWFIENNSQPEYIDHINGVKDDNRMCNIRSTSHKENHRNRPLNKNSTSKVVGVNWQKSNSKWRAYIYIDGKQEFLGYYIEKDDAINARKEAEIEYGFHDNHGRCIV